MSTLPQLISTFTLGDLNLGVDALQVQEIIKVPNRTKVFLAPEHVWGVINLRGRIVTVWDLRVLMGLPAWEVGEETRIIVVQLLDEPVGFLVDTIRDVTPLDSSALRPVPGNVDPSQGRYLYGIAGEGEEIIGLLDLSSLEKELQG